MNNNLIMKYVILSGYSHIFPFGSRVLVIKKEKDKKKDKEFYHAIFFTKDNVSIETTFDIDTLVCANPKYQIKLSQKPELVQC